jgi:hypothetical protein
MAGERIVARDMRDEGPVPALPAVKDERDVCGERAVGAEHEQTETDSFDRFVQDWQLALDVVRVDVHPQSLVPHWYPGTDQARSLQIKTSRFAAYSLG